MNRLFLKIGYLLSRLLWIALFIAFFLFSWKNTTPVSLHVWRGTDIEVPTIAALLFCFLMGGVCHALISIWRRRAKH